MKHLTKFSLNEGTKTPNPVKIEEAKKLLFSLLKKADKGFDTSHLDVVPGGFETFEVVDTSQSKRGRWLVRFRTDKDGNSIHMNTQRPEYNYSPLNKGYSYNVCLISVQIMQNEDKFESIFK